MSKKDLSNFHDYIEELLMRKSETYRTEVSDLEPHTISLSIEGLVSEIEIALAKRNLEVDPQKTPALKELVDTEAENMYNDLYNKLDPENFLTGRRKFATADRIPHTGGDSFTVVLFAKNQAEGRSVFAYFRKMKQQSQRKLIKKLNAYIAKVNRGRKDENQAEKIVSASFLDITHQEGSEVASQRINAIKQKIAALAVNDKHLSLLTSKFKALGIDLTITKTGDNIEVSIGDARANRQSGSTDEKAKFEQLRKDLLAVLRSIPAQELAEISGSDSMLSASRKRAILKVAEAFRKIDGVTITGLENTKIKKSRSKVEERKTGKVKKAKSFTEDISFTGLASKEKASVRQQPTRLMALINAKLPETVAKNMGAPRLENRTGRFASSPRVTDIQQTPRGFPSIGYTYEIDPYSVFESTSGTRFASTERDTRSLIDLSIREIAQQMAIGRFYTRRV